LLKLQAGLADAESKASFTKMLYKVKEKWNNLEKSCNPDPNAAPIFYAWFCQHKADVIKLSVLPEVRQQAGCANPSSFFTTNSSESMNHIIKQEVEWKERSLKTIVADQVSESERAVIGCGEWHSTAEYKHLKVPESSWFFDMTDAAKKLHMKSVSLQSSYEGSSVIRE